MNNSFIRNNMRRIVMLLSNPFRPDPRVLKEAESIAELGYQITILCWDRLSEFPAEEKINSRINIFREQNVRSGYGIGARQIFNLPRFWLSAYRQISHLKPDILHCHDFDTLPIGLLWGKIHRIPIVYDSHEYYADLVRQRLTGILGKFLYEFIKTAEKLFAHISNAIVTVDSNMAGIYKRINKNVLIVGHYPRKRFAENFHNVFENSQLTLLYAGRISSDRGSLIYIEILRELIKQNIPARLILAGVFTPQSERVKFMQASVDLNNYIHYKGWITYPDINSIYRKADIGLSILLPEKRYVAALPVKLFEYMAAGIPVIASNFPAITSIINQSNCGAVIDPLSSPGDIAEIIRQWWIDPTIPKTLGENGRQAILHNYNWEDQIKDLSYLYGKLLN